MNQKGFATILILFIMLIISSGIIAGAYYFGTRKPAPVVPSPSPEATPPIQQETPMPSTIYNCKSDTDCPAGQRCQPGLPECAPPPPGVHSGCESRCVISDKTAKMKICPDEWIVNKMPGTADIKETTPREYFVIDSKRRELAEFDIGWIKSNCSVKEPSPVY